MKKCGTLTINRGKVVRCEGIKLPNSNVMKEVEKEGYTYLGIVALDKIKENEMKENRINERYGQKIKENNDNVWSVTSEEQCGQILHKEEGGRQRSDEY